MTQEQEDRFFNRLSKTPGFFFLQENHYLKSVTKSLDGELYQVGIINNPADAIMFMHSKKMFLALVENVILYEDNFDDADECIHIQNQIGSVESASGRPWSEVVKIYKECIDARNR